MAAMAPEKSRSLHNFSLPPRLSWGSQRLLRCSNSNPTTNETAAAAVDADYYHYRRTRPHQHYHPYDGSSSSSRSRRDPADPDRNPRSLQSSPDNPLNASAVAIGRRFDGGDEDYRIEVMREKLMLDFQTEVDKMKNAILAEGGAGESYPRQPPPLTGDLTAVAVEQRPWNLRTRRAACVESNANGGADEGKNLRGDEARPPSAISPPLAKLPRVRSDWDGENSGGVGSGACCGERRERAKFSVSLSREEIEEDFMELTRRRCPRKPKKRPKYVQKQLDTLFPGLWLSEITADMYKVNENPETVKGQ